jgi:CheY-like chemotaxis protein
MTIAQAKSIFLADDDDDDCLLFQDALREICSRTQLTTAKDGMELMGKLEETVPPPPDVIFLDLNMPVKTGLNASRKYGERIS